MMKTCFTGYRRVVFKRGLLLVGALLGLSSLLASARAADLPLLVDSAWVNSHLSSPDLIVVDARTDKEYAQGHLPRAILLDFSDLSTKTTESELEAFRSELAKRLSVLGYSGAEPVVFYDDGREIQAPRALWNFLYAGGNQGCIMSGGWNQWKKGGYLMAWDRPERTPREFPFKENASILATSDLLATRLKDFSTRIVDVRSLAEYDGSSQAHPASRYGHIPGAHWFEWTEMLDPDHNLLPANELRKKLAQADITPDKEIILYCHRGNRASNSFLALRALGFTKVRNYIGSWSDWADRLDLPVEKKETADSQESSGNIGP